MMMKNAIVKWAIASALLMTAGSAAAVSLSAHGSGQVLLFPYYTVNGGNQTLLTIRNTALEGKALRVRVLEARNGRAALEFNLYMSAYDVWNAVVFSISPGGPANLLTDDSTCTAPAIRENATLPILPDGRHYVPFRNFAYTGANDDAGPDGLDRTREGLIEVIEMGAIPFGTPISTAITHVNGVPLGCQRVQTGFLPGGFWATNPKVGLTNPSGGLSGNVAIINSNASTLYTYNASALEGFREDNNARTASGVVLHTSPGSASPSLRDAISDPASGSASASVLVGGRLLHVDYPAGRTIDAVSAALSSETLVNDYLVDPALHAGTDWVLSFPTKPYYTDQALVGSNAIAPFTTIYPSTGSEPEFCQFLARQLLNRDEQLIQEDCLFGEGPPGCARRLQMCFVTQVQALDKDSSGQPQSVLGSTLIAGGDLIFPLDIAFRAGWQRFTFGGGPYGDPFLMRPASNGEVFVGLPALGFSATYYSLDNGQGGTGSHFAGALQHQSTVKCWRGELYAPHPDC
jgi:hypothetical protein